jgi:hypothetical protein
MSIRLVSVNDQSKFKVKDFPFLIYAEPSEGGRKITKNFHFLTTFYFHNDFFTLNQPSSLYKYVENKKGEEDLRAGYFCNYL